MTPGAGPSPLAFVGVGKMGLPMDGHLAAAGHAVTAFDPSPGRRALAAAAGLVVADDVPAALAAARGVACLRATVSGRATPRWPSERR